MEAEGKDLSGHIAVLTASDIDGDLLLLALPEAVNPHEWEVVVVRSDGTRAMVTGEPGAGGIYPGFGARQPDFKYHWWAIDGFSDCHAEIRVPATGEFQRVALRPTDGGCPECSYGRAASPQ